MLELFYLNHTEETKIIVLGLKQLLETHFAASL